MAQCVKCTDRYVQRRHRKMSSHSSGRVREGSLEERVAWNLTLYRRKSIQIDLERERGCTVCGPWHGIVLDLSQSLTIKGSWVFLLSDLPEADTTPTLCLLIKNLHLHWTHVTLTKQNNKIIVIKGYHSCIKKKKKPFSVWKAKRTVGCYALFDTAIR